MYVLSVCLSVCLYLSVCFAVVSNLVTDKAVFTLVCYAVTVDCILYGLVQSQSDLLASGHG